MTRFCHNISFKLLWYFIRDNRYKTVPWEIFYTIKVWNETKFNENKTNSNPYNLVPRAIFK